MKKIMFFLIVFFSIIFFNTLNVDASTTKFYEGEYINGVYINKKAAGSKTIYYLTVRFIRQTGTNIAAYCIEPFNSFNEQSTYESTINPKNLSQYQKDRISKLAHFGYGYKIYTDPKWYAITQMLIWKTVDPTADFYFTDTLNGNRVNLYENEMNQINALIENYDAMPSMSNKEYFLVEGESLDILDTNYIINAFTPTNNTFYIDASRIKTNPLKEGIYETDIIRESSFNHNTPVIFYKSANSQELVTLGNIEAKKAHIKINVLKTNLEITKIDSNTKTTIPSGDAKLEGAIYQIYDKDMNEIDTITINENNKGIKNNLPFGKYYLKEIKAGTGYTLDDTIYEFELTKDNNEIKLTLENKVIEANVEINKEYGDKTFKKEANISFDIYNKNNELIKTVTTNEQGHIEFMLPFGKYIIKQKNSTNGYKKVDDFEINIENTEKKVFNLTDLKIKVPNTKTSNNTLKIIGTIILLCLKILV